MADASAQGNAASSSAGGSKILLLLEGVALRRELSGVLRDRRVDVVVAATVDEAMARWDGTVRVVLVDAVFAPEASPLLERARESEVRVLVAGTGLQGVDIMSLIESGARGYIPMPQPVELVAKQLIEHKQSEDAIRTSFSQVVMAKSELEAVFDTFPSPLFIVGRDMIIRRANKATLHLSGQYSYKELVGMDCCDALGCSMRDRCTIRDALKKGEKLSDDIVAEGEWTHPILGRRYRPRILSTGTSTDEEGTLGNGVLIMVEDVTMVRKFQSRDFREQKLNAVGLLAATLSHEINQPLGAIMGRAQLAIIGLERDAVDLPALKKDLEEIVLNVNRVSQILDKLHQVTDIVTKPYLGEMEILDLDKSSSHEEKPGGAEDAS
jgi:hypothetical protein